MIGQNPTLNQNLCFSTPQSWHAGSTFFYLFIFILFFYTVSISNIES